MGLVEPWMCSLLRNLMVLLHRSAVSLTATESHCGQEGGGAYQPPGEARLLGGENTSLEHATVPKSKRTYSD